MTYRLNENAGDSIAVPQLVFRHLDRAGGDPVRGALYMIATRCTDGFIPCFFRCSITKSISR